MIFKVATCDSVPTGRQDVATGASPWTGMKNHGESRRADMNLQQIDCIGLSCLNLSDCNRPGPHGPGRVCACPPGLNRKEIKAMHSESNDHVQTCPLFLTMPKTFSRQQCA